MKYIALLICVSFAQHIYSSEITEKKEPLLLPDLRNKKVPQSQENNVSAQLPRDPRSTIRMCSYDYCSEENERGCGQKTAVYCGCVFMWSFLCTGLFCPQICRR